LGIVPSSWGLTTEIGGAFRGDSAANLLSGTVARDTLSGNGGSDTLTGGAGADTFDFNAVSDSTPALGDRITDFKHGIDKIDVADIDANTGTPLDQAFVFGGNNASTLANSLTWFENAGNTILNFDNTGDATADMQITLTGINLGLTATDFVL
jgi:Ca2+-binding RTX toxin-like protein